jgi:pimeloyl-ACP methyl ester carboxylesterase
LAKNNSASGPARARRYGVMLTLLGLLPLAAAAQAPLTAAHLDQFEAQKTAVVLRNGEKLAYIDAGPRDAPPLVLIHGYTDSARDWAPIAPLLTPQFRLIIVDLRGHGASGKPDCCYARFDFAYDIKLLLDALHIRTANVAGHSLGSIVAQTFAELWPESTRRLVLISSTGTSFGPAEPARSPTSTQTPAGGWLAAVAELNDPIDPDSAFMRDWWKVSIAYNPEFARRQRRDAAAIPARVWRAIADQCLVGVDLRGMLPRVQASTLLIWGARDTLVSEAGREALRSGIAQVDVRTFASLGHDLFWEDPRGVAAVMIEFLTKP